MPAGLLATVALGALLYTLVSLPPSPPTTIIDTYEIMRPLAKQPEPPIETPREIAEWTPPVVAAGPFTIAPPPKPEGGFPIDAPWGGFMPTLFGPGGAQSSTFVTQAPQRLFDPFVDYPQAMYPREGSCEVRFDITAAGGTTNVQAASCTDRGFARAAERTVRGVLYRPAQGEMGPIASVGHVLVVEFNLEE
jgi:TonB family protein